MGWFDCFTDRDFSIFERLVDAVGGRDGLEMTRVGDGLIDAAGLLEVTLATFEIRKGRLDVQL